MLLLTSLITRISVTAELSGGRVNNAGGLLDIMLHSIIVHLLRYVFVE
jgi:hypothetical protein